MSPLAWVGFVIAAAVGGPARYLVDGYVSERFGGSFPWGTLVVNASGSFLFGWLTGLGLYHGLPKTTRVVLGTAFCGAYTTFSTFTLQTVRMGDDEGPAPALRNVIGTVVTCAGAAALGLALAAL